jgi:hypothetical protein
LDSISRRFTVIEYGMHLLGDRHFHSARFRQLHRGVGGKDTLRYHAVHAGNNFGELSTSTEFYSDAAISRKSSGAGQDQITKTGEAG